MKITNDLLWHLGFPDLDLEVGAELSEQWLVHASATLGAASAVLATRACVAAAVPGPRLPRVAVPLEGGQITRPGPVLFPRLPPDLLERLQRGKK